MAVQNLRKTPHISEILLREVRGPKRALALDAITALRLTGLAPKLLDLAADDESGQVYLTVDSLITAENVTTVLRVYRERLLCRGGMCSPTPDAAKIVMLETLGRTETELSARDLSSLFERNEYEVKSAVLRYIRHFLLVRPNKDYFDIARAAVHARPVQIRHQALSLLAEVKEVAPENRRRPGGRL